MVQELIMAVFTPNTGGQLARLHRHVDKMIFIAWRIRSHASMVL